jgi:cobalt-zinc-cadmium efflux system protein
MRTSENAPSEGRLLNETLYCPSLPSRKKTKVKQRLSLGLIFTAGMMGVELIGGWLSGSLALISDAGHMFTHFIALLIALISVFIAARPASTRYTYGFYRAEIIGGLFNAIFIIGISIYIFIEAIQRIFNPVPIAIFEVLLIGFLGLLVNIATAIILHGVTHEDLNVKGAFIHVLGDTLSSISVIIAAIFIFFTNYVIADTLASVFIALIILVWGLELVRDTLLILLQSTPKHIELNQLIKEVLQQFPEISDIYDVHLWTLTPGNYFLSGHIVTCTDCSLSEANQLTDAIKRFLADHYAIHHTTLQIECSSFE